MDKVSTIFAKLLTTLFAIGYFIILASVIVVPLILIVKGLWGWAIVYFVIGFAVASMIDSI